MFLLLLIVLLSACSNTDELSGKTFDLSVRSSPDSPPDQFSPIVTLEFLDGNIVKNKKGHEEGTYELKDDQLVIQFENENEYLAIEFTLKESDDDISEYSAEISDSKYEIEDSKIVSKFKGFYERLSVSHFQFIER